MRRIKAALDPRGIMNPGVIFDVPAGLPLPLGEGGGEGFELPLRGPVGEPAVATIDPG
jgi:hypothetical protein